jgi:hypothetical protein
MNLEDASFQCIVSMKDERNTIINKTKTETET